MKKILILLTTIVLVSSCSTFKSETKTKIASSENQITRNIASCDSIFKPSKFLDYINIVVKESLHQPWYYFGQTKEAFQLLMFQYEKILYRGKQDYIYSYNGNGKFTDEKYPDKYWFQFFCPDLSSFMDGNQLVPQILVFDSGEGQIKAAYTDSIKIPCELSKTFLTEEAYKSVCSSKK